MTSTMLTNRQVLEYRQKYGIGQFKKQPDSYSIGTVFADTLDAAADTIENATSYVSEPINKAASAMNRGFEAVSGIDGVDSSGQKLIQGLGQKYEQNVPEVARDAITVGTTLFPAAKAATPLVKAGAGAMKEATAGATQGLRQGVGGAIEATGQKIQTTALKPSIKDVKDGFKIENISKYNVGGSPQEILAKSQIELNKRAQALKTIAENSDAYVDMSTVFERTAQALKGNKTKSFGDNAAIESVIQKLKSEVDAVAPDGATTFSDALDIKRSAGNKGAWAYNRPEPDASAMEEVYTTFYNELKKEMETVAPEGYSELNKQLSELIPIQNAAIRRVPVEERNNAIGLLESIGLAATVYDPSALALTMTARATKSGKVGNALTKAGQAIKGEVSSPGTKSSKPSKATSTSTSNAPIETAAGSKPETAISGGGKGEATLIAEVKKYKSAEEFVNALAKDKTLQTPELMKVAGIDKLYTAAKADFERYMAEMRAIPEGIPESEMKVRLNQIKDYSPVTDEQIKSQLIEIWNKANAPKQDKRK